MRCPAWFWFPVFLLVTTWAVADLFVLPPAMQFLETRPRLRPGLVSADLRLLYERLRDTAPVDFDPGWRPPRLRPDWQWIIVHHSASLTGNAAILDRYHRTKEHPMENGLAYHFVIGNGTGSPDGRVEVGHRWTEQLDGGHVRGDELNRIAIGICLVGDFEHALPTEKQIASLKALLNYLLDVTRIDSARVCGHKDAPDQKTLCPGRYLPVDEVMARRR